MTFNEHSFSLGQEIINGVEAFTGDLQIGLGAFIEKSLPPFSSAYPENNCRTKGEDCDQPYSFIHKVCINTGLRFIFARAILSTHFD